MGVVTLKVTGNARRNMSVMRSTQKGADAPRSLKKIKKNAAGRNKGKISIRHRGGRSKQFYRDVDFSGRDKLGVPGKIASIDYDPSRTCNIALIHYVDGDKRYRLAHKGAKIGDMIMTDKAPKVKEGNRMELNNVPVGFFIYNLELVAGNGGVMVRTAGGSAQLIGLDGEKAQVLLPSGEIRLFEKHSFATVGVLGNDDHSLMKIGKAGRKRNMGRRPQVRGKAMNPIDHPHGGGEGGCPIGMTYPKTPWGSHALGVKTRNKKKSNRLIVRSRHRAS